MRRISHAIIGTAVACALFRHTGMELGMATSGAAVLGGLLPDMDEEHSTINKLVPLGRGKLIYAVGAAGLAYLAFSAGRPAYLAFALVSLLVFISSHRGFTHSILACAIFSLPLLPYRGVFTAFSAAYGAHIVCDMLNEKGLQLLYPLKLRIKSPMGFSMDSLIGRAIEAGAVLLSLWVMARAYMG